MVDFLLVGLGVFETWVLPFTNGCSANSSVKIFLILRILRILRVIRFFKLVRSFEQLWLIVSGVTGALKTVFWVFLLLALLLYMCAIFTTTQLGYSEHFRSIPQSMLSLWQIATLDSWADTIVRPIIADSPFMIIFFLAFIFCVTYGIFNVILGIVVETTIQSSHSQSEKSERERAIEKQVALSSFARVLELSDSNDSGKITKAEFVEISKLEEVDRVLIRTLRLSFEDISEIFDTLSDPGDPDKGLPISELMAAISQLTASASSFQRDLGNVLITLEGLTNRVSTMETHVRSLDREVDHLCFKAEQFAKSTLYFLTGNK